MPYAPDRSGRWSLDPAVLEAQCYTDRYSFEPGEVMRIHASTSSPSQTIGLEIVRDLPAPAVVHTAQGIACGAHDAPEHAYAEGCGWPVCYELPLPRDWRSGFYLIRVKAADGEREFTAEHFFVLRRPADQAPQADLVVVLATNTWTAYNECATPPVPLYPQPPASQSVSPTPTAAASAGATTTRASRSRPARAAAPA